jgi:hypothetical protein
MANHGWTCLIGAHAVGRAACHRLSQTRPSSECGKPLSGILLPVEQEKVVFVHLDDMEPASHVRSPVRQDFSIDERIGSPPRSASAAALLVYHLMRQIASNCRRIGPGGIIRCSKWYTINNSPARCRRSNDAVPSRAASAILFLPITVVLTITDGGGLPSLSGGTAGIRSSYQDDVYCRQGDDDSPRNTDSRS